VPPADPAATRKANIDSYVRNGYTFARWVASLDGKPIYRPKQVIVLCDAVTYSAAFQAMFYLRGLGAKIVGVPSAQAPNTFTSGDPFTLPESGLTGSISNGAQIFMPVEPNARILTPDFPVDWQTFRKYNFDEQTILRYALDLIAAGRL
jgi:hypothetical protein